MVKEVGSNSSNKVQKGKGPKSSTSTQKLTSKSKNAHSTVRPATSKKATSNSKGNDKQQARKSNIVPVSGKDGKNSSVVIEEDEGISSKDAEDSNSDYSEGHEDYEYADKDDEDDEDDDDDDDDDDDEDDGEEEEGKGKGDGSNGVTNGNVKDKSSVTAKKPNTAENKTTSSKRKGAMDEAESSDQDKEEASDEDEESLLHGFSDDSESENAADSSDEDDEDDEAARRHSEIQTAKLPQSKDDEAVQKRLDKVKEKRKASGTASMPAVLYVGRLPHGFYEASMRSYFSQFGDVRRLRVSRNRRTGAAKHYAFIEFDDTEVAHIVAETMNNYLIDGHLLQVHVIPSDKVHPKLWIGANRTWRNVPTDRRERVQHDKPKTEEQRAKVERKLLERQQKRRRRIADLGIDYDFDGYK